jgi:two-component system sensor histidine kinase and response regulator WspE
VSPDLSKFSLWDLYRGEVETHSKALNDGLLALEERPGDVDRLKALMRAAHSIKGAARVVQYPLAVEVAHALEDRFVAAQTGTRPLGADDVQRLLEGVDLLGRLSPADEAERERAAAAAAADAAKLVAALSAAARAGTPTAAPAPERAATMPGPAPPAAPQPGPPPAAAPVVASAPSPGPASAPLAPPFSTRAPLAAPTPSTAPSSTPVPTGAASPVAPVDAADRSLRLTAQTVTRLMGLAGESVVATRWLEPFVRELSGTKKRLADLSATLDRLEAELEAAATAERVTDALNQAQGQLERTRADLTERIASIEQFSLRQETLAARLYREVLATRMRPFGDLVEGFPRLVRDLARQLGKKVRLQIDGLSTDVDRDVAALLDAPLNHVVRNAVDHGIEPPAARLAAGKAEAATIRLSAWHRAGMLLVEVADDGRGVDLEGLRRKVVERALVDEATSRRLSEQELLEFLFLPGFTTATTVTDVSGRGVGLDVVLETMKKVGGRARMANRPGRGLSVTFELPVSLSVLRALIVEVGGEPFALPLTRLERVLAVPATDVQTVEGRQYVSVPADGVSDRRAAARVGDGAGQLHIGLATARQVLGLPGEIPGGTGVAVVVVRHGEHRYGIVADRILGEEVVVVRPLDARLGKVPGVSAAALSADGSPLLVLDVDDMLRAVEQILESGSLAHVGASTADEGPRRKRILIVDDSATVREVERQSLEAHGYVVEMAVDGMDGWNAVRTGQYDLVVTDVDMPRLDGIELVRRLRADPRYRLLPVIIVSYKDREEDRLRGLDAGASYYLPKAAFHDASFLQAVDELIGGAEA